MARTPPDMMNCKESLSTAQTLLVLCTVYNNLDANGCVYAKPSFLSDLKIQGTFITPSTCVRFVSTERA